MIIIDSNKIDEYNEARKQAISTIKSNEYYVAGKNPVTLSQPPMEKPDNRITIPLGKVAVDTLQGYAGRAGDISLIYEPIKVNTGTKGNDLYLDTQRQIAEHNNESLEISELYREALVQGFAYELFWVSDDLHLKGVMTPEYTRVPPEEIYIVWSRELKPKKEVVLRFQTFSDMEQVDVYYPEYSEQWIKKDKNSLWVRNRDGDTRYPYKKPPLVEYKINAEKVSLFEAEKGLIDANDKILNRTVNEIDRFNALIMLMPGKITKEIKDKLIEVGVLDDLNDFDMLPQYLQKDLSGIGEIYSNTAKWVKELFFQSISIPDFSDKNFLNTASGIAMAYKLIGLEFLASKVETYFNMGLKERFELITDVLAESSKYNAREYKLAIDSKRNLPLDKNSIVDMVIKLHGIVSRETLLKMLPQNIVDDVDMELKRIEEDNGNIDLGDEVLTVNE